MVRQAGSTSKSNYLATSFGNVAMQCKHPVAAHGTVAGAAAAAAAAAAH